MLTKAELLFAAAVAERYPPGHGRHYGFSRRLASDMLETETIDYLLSHPRAAAYG